MSPRHFAFFIFFASTFWAPCGAIRADVVAGWVTAAREHNASLQRVKAEAAGALARVPQAKSLPDPTVEIGTTGTDEVIGAFQYARLAQAFPWPGTLGGRESVASFEARARWLQIQSIELDVVAQVRALAAEMAYLHKEAELIRENVMLFKKQEDLLEQTARGGGDVSDLVRVEMNAGLLDNELQDNSERLTRQLAELSAVVGKQIDTSTAAKIKLPTRLGPTENSDRLVAELPVRNPTLQALASRVDAARAGHRVARLETYPEFLVSAGYRNFVGPDMGGGTDRRSEATVMFSVSIPIWGEKNEGKKAEAAAAIDVAVQELEDATRILRARLESLLSRDRYVRQRASLFEDQLVPQARQIHETVEASYRAGKASLLDVFDARRRLLETETGFWRAIADSHIAQAEIDALFGTEIQIRKP